MEENSKPADDLGKQTEVRRSSLSLIGATLVVALHAVHLLLMPLITVLFASKSTVMHAHHTGFSRHTGLMSFANLMTAATIVAAAFILVKLFWNWREAKRRPLRFATYVILFVSCLGMLLTS